MHLTHLLTHHKNDSLVRSFALVVRHFESPPTSSLYRITRRSPGQAHVHDTTTKKCNLDNIVSRVEGHEIRPKAFRWRNDIIAVSSVSGIRNWELSNEPRSLMLSMIIILNYLGLIFNLYLTMKVPSGPIRRDACHVKWKVIDVR